MMRPGVGAAVVSSDPTTSGAVPFVQYVVNVTSALDGTFCAVPAESVRNPVVDAGVGTVGRAVGARDGVFEGLLDGVLDGIDVVGVPDGLFDGVRDGLDVVGVLDGDFDGVLDGLPVSGGMHTHR